MKTTFLLISLSGAFLCTGCLDKPGDVAAEHVVKIDAIESQMEYDVPVRSGQATIVTLGDDTLAVTNEPRTILVPRYAVAENALEITYSDEDIYKNFSSDEFWQYLSFEDSRNGDYDYNDLVIHCRIVNTNAGMVDGVKMQKHVVGVQPVALGGARKLRLGILYKETADADHLSEKILCEDVRAELFNGIASFPINTDPMKEIKQVSAILAPKFEITNADLKFRVVWFIEVGTDRLYAATTNFDADKTLDMISLDGLPYGISLTKKWDYPIEKCPIQEAYPGFGDWIRNGNESALLGTSIKGKTFPASINKLWDYDNRF